MCPVYVCLSGFRNYILNDRVIIVLERKKNIGMKLPNLKCHTIFLYCKDSEIVGFL